MKYPISDLNKVKRGPKRASYDVTLVHEILDADFMCNIGYEYDGHIIVIPMAYGRNGDKIYIHGSIKNRMMLSMLAKGKGSISVSLLDGLVLARSAFHHSANYRSVTVFGSLTEVTDAKEKMEALACITNHMLPGRWEDCRQPNEKEFKATLVISLSIESASAKVRAEGVVDDKEDYNSDFWAGIVPISKKIGVPISDDRLPKNIDIPKSVLAYAE